MSFYVTFTNKRKKDSEREQAANYAVKGEEREWKNKINN